MVKNIEKKIIKRATTIPIVSELLSEIQLPKICGEKPRILMNIKYISNIRNEKK